MKYLPSSHEVADQDTDNLQCSTYSDRDAVVAFQVIAIYMLMRISEEGDDAASGDASLVCTITVSFRYVYSQMCADRHFAARRSLQEGKKLPPDTKDTFTTPCWIGEPG